MVNRHPGVLKVPLWTLGFAVVSPWANSIFKHGLCGPKAVCVFFNTLINFQSSKLRTLYVKICISFFSHNSEDLPVQWGCISEGEQYLTRVIPNKFRKIHPTSVPPALSSKIFVWLLPALKFGNSNIHLTKILLGFPTFRIY